jgi:hypothetical protein
MVIIGCAFISMIVALTTSAVAVLLAPLSALEILVTVVVSANMTAFGLALRLLHLAK